MCFPYIATVKKKPNAFYGAPPFFIRSFAGLEEA